MKEFVSIICPVYNEERYIARCVDSVLDSDWPRGEMELLLVDGGSTDRTREIIKEYAAKYPFIRLLDNPDKIVPPAMNIGIRESKGDVIVRIDAHSAYSPDYIPKLAAGLKDLNADNVGATWHTGVLNATPKTLTIREVLTNRFGVGNAVFRTGTDTIREVDTVPFGCWPRRVFDIYGFFDTRLTRNQDIELNKRIKRGGGKIYLLPEALCTYYARETYRAVARNNFQNGKWNILTVWHTGTADSLSARHFVPLVFLLSLVVPAAFSPLWFPLIWMSAASLAAYTVAVTAISLKLAVGKHLNFFYLVWAFAVLHFSYGAGSLAGIASLPFTKRK